MTPLWGAVVLIVVAPTGVMTYAPFYDLQACFAARQDMAVFSPGVRAKCVPTVTAHPAYHTVQ